MRADPHAAADPDRRDFAVGDQLVGTTACDPQDLRDLRGLVLYGSQIRGEADEGSDVDLLLLLEEPVEVGREIRRSSGVVASLALEAGLALSLIPVGIEQYRASSDPYLINARREGAIVPPAPG